MDFRPPASSRQAFHTNDYRFEMNSMGNDTTKRPAGNRRITARARNHLLRFDTLEVGSQASNFLLTYMFSICYDSCKGEKRY
jgi:hypothetical protein